MACSVARVDQRIDGELVISLLEEGERVGQPRLQPVEPADIEIDTGAGGTHPAEQSPVVDGNGISLRRVEQPLSLLVVPAVLAGDDRLAAQHHAALSARRCRLGDEVAHPPVEDQPLSGALPDEEQVVHETEAELGLLRGHRMLDGGCVQRAVVGDLVADPRRREVLALELGQLADAVVDEAIEHLVALAGGEAFLAHGANHLQQSVPRRPGPVLGGHERLLGQRVHRVGDHSLRTVARARHGGGGGQPEASREHRQPAQHGALGVMEEPDAPLDRRMEGTVTRRTTVAAVRQPGGVLSQQMNDLTDRKRRHPRRGQLDGERHAIQQLRHRCDLVEHGVVGDQVGPNTPGAIEEQLAGHAASPGRQRCDVDDVLAGHPQRRTAGCQHRRLALHGKVLGDRRRGVDDVLAVVQHDDRRLRRQGSLDRRSWRGGRIRAERRSDDRIDIALVRRNSQVDEARRVRLVCGDR